MRSLSVTRWLTPVRGLALAAALTAAAPAAGTPAFKADDVRLSGVIEGGANTVALVAMADGSTRSLRLGDRLGDAEVIAIAKEGVRLRLPQGGEQILTLQGLADVETPHDVARRLNEINRVQLLKALKAAKAAPADQPQQQRLAEILGLPKTTSVVAVNGANVGGDPIGALANALSSAPGGVKLGLAGLGGSQEIYFHPLTPPSPAEVTPPR